MKKRLLIILLGLILINNNSLIGQNDTISANKSEIDYEIQNQLKEKEANDKLLVEIEKFEKEKKAELKKQVNIVYSAVFVFLLLIILSVGLLIRNRKVSKLLKEAQKKIRELKKENKDD